LFENKRAAALSGDPRQLFGNPWLPQTMCALLLDFRRSSAAVATSREGRRSN
jgi:hypothetical protein